MSNLADLLKQIAGSNSEAIEFIGNSLGTLADVSGAVGTVLGAISLFVSQDDQTAAKLDELQATLEANFAEIKEDLKASSILTWENKFAEPLATARSALDTANAALTLGSPVSDEFRLTQLDNCRSAAYQFDLDSQWRRSYLDEVYYDDGNGWLYWLGRVAPNPEPDGTVFTDRYILPLFLRVVSIYVAVAAAYYPKDFRSTERDGLRILTRRMEWAHNVSSSGIVSVRLPTVPETSIDRTFPFPPPFRYINYSEWERSFASEEYWWHGTWNSFQLFGAIHTYSGASATDNYPPIPCPTDRSLPLLVRAARLYARLALANRARWKDVYIGVGLADLWDMINTMRALTSDSPLSGVNQGRWWSLREIHDLLGDAYRDPSETQIRGYATIARLMWLVRWADGRSPDGPLAGPALSWRTALTQATLRIAVPDPGIGNY